MNRNRWEKQIPALRFILRPSWKRRLAAALRIHGGAVKPQLIQGTAPFARACAAPLGRASQGAATGNLLLER
ncbi:hypothetical protein [Brevibacillus brevis]|uniref:Uncharacterized protein n=1 Tax=Brevibacillus brevis TaxID=1393 RepID=A0ABY9T461_BREBE|nr:hypothetical protein [Brevibacillus brevis]WNC13737.1 hypothetical protein RGB73_24100 [Brevibacillus brevis]